MRYFDPAFDEDNQICRLYPGNVLEGQVRNPAAPLCVYEFTKIRLKSHSHFVSARSLCRLRIQCLLDREDRFRIYFSFADLFIGIGLRTKDDNISHQERGD